MATLLGRSMSAYTLACMECGIPEHMVGVVYSYIEHGTPPGGFLTAVLSNDLIGALGQGDDQNVASLPAWGRLLYTHFPSIAYGSAAAVEEWIKEKARPTCVRCDDVMPDAACGHLCSKCLAREGKFCIRCGRIMAADTKKAVCPKCLADDDVDGLGEGNEI